MSAYVNRLIDRISPSRGEMPPQAEPFVRSHSPIADFDQRPGSEDSLVFEGLAAPDESTNIEAPAAIAPPTRIHRKTSAQSLSPTASVSAAPITPSPTVAPVAPPASPAAPIAAPRSEPMDPGPLFDIFPRYFDASEPASPVSSPTTPELRHASSPSPREPVSPAPARPSPTSFEPEPSPGRLTPAPARNLELRVPSVDPQHPAPWQPIERNIPERSPTVTPLVTPASPRERELAPSSRPLAPVVEPEPVPTPRHYATPRPPAAAAYVPDPGPRASADPGAATRPRVHIGHVEIEVIPSNPPPPAQSGASASKQTLSIDSISQIGPLGHYFPSRRRLRLRYR